MDIFAIVLLTVLSVYGMRLSGEDVDPLAVDQTTSVKGICALLVFFRHIVFYVQMDMNIDRLLSLQVIIGQMIVVPFLFYSGYGIMYSILNKQDYIKTIWRKRILRLYLYFLFIWLSFFAIDYILGIQYDRVTILKSLFIWESIGNSTWFLFGIIVMYILTWLCFVVTDKRQMSLLFLLILVALYYAVMYRLKSDTHWYDTIFAYYVGVLYACLKRLDAPTIRFNGFKSTRKWLLSLIISAVILFCFLGLTYRWSIMLEYQIFEFCAVMSCIASLIIANKRIIIGNRVIDWIGKHSFEVYMLQRIPMIVFQRIDSLTNTYKTLYAVICLTTTLFISWFYKMVFNRIYDRISGQIWSKTT